MPSPMHLRQNRPPAGRYGEEEISDSTPSRYEGPKSTRPAVTPPPPVQFNPDVLSLAPAVFPTVSTEEAASREHQRRVVGAISSRIDTDNVETENEVETLPERSSDSPQASQSVHSSTDSSQAPQPVHNAITKLNPSVRRWRASRRPQADHSEIQAGYSGTQAGHSGTQAGGGETQVDTDPSNRLRWQAAWWTDNDQARFMWELETSDEDGMPTRHLGKQRVTWHEVMPDIRIEIVANLCEMGLSSEQVIERLHLTSRQRTELERLIDGHNRNIKKGDRKILGFFNHIHRKVLSWTEANKPDEKTDVTHERLKEWINDLLDLKAPKHCWSMEKALPQTIYGKIVNRKLEEIRDAYCCELRRMSRKDLKKARLWLRQRGLSPTLAGKWKNVDRHPDVAVQLVLEEPEIGTPLYANMQAVPSQVVQAAQAVQAVQAPQTARAATTATTASSPRSRVVGRNLMINSRARRQTSNPKMNPSTFVPDAVYAPLVPTNQPSALSLPNMMLSTQQTNMPYFQQRQDQFRDHTSRRAHRMNSTSSIPSPLLQEIQARVREALPPTLGIPAPTAVMMAVMMPVIPDSMTPVVPSNSTPEVEENIAHLGEILGHKRANEENPEFAHPQTAASETSSKRQKRNSSSNVTDTPASESHGRTRAPSVGSNAGSVSSSSSTFSTQSGRAMRSHKARSLPRRFSGPHTEIGATGYSHIDEVARLPGYSPRFVYPEPPLDHVLNQMNSDLTSGFTSNSTPSSTQPSSYPQTGMAPLPPAGLGRHTGMVPSRFSQPDMMTPQGFSQSSMMPSQGYVQSGMMPPQGYPQSSMMAPQGHPRSRMMAFSPGYAQSSMMTSPSQSFMLPSTGQTTAYPSFASNVTYSTAHTSFSSHAGPSAMAQGGHQGWPQQVDVPRKRGRPRKDDTTPRVPRRPKTPKTPKEPSARKQ